MPPSAKVAERTECSGNPGLDSTEVRQRGFLSAAQMRRESWALTASAAASRADGVLDSELRQVWLRRSGTMFGVNLSVFKILLALIDAVFKMGNYAAPWQPEQLWLRSFPDSWDVLSKWK